MSKLKIDSLKAGETQVASITVAFTARELGNIVLGVFTPVLAKHSKSFSLKRAGTRQSRH